MKQNPPCKHCKSRNSVKKGVRKLKDKNQRQMHLCKSCNKVFTPDTAAGKRTDPKIILTAITKYCQNLTLEQTQKLIKKQYKTKPAISAIHKWIQEFNPRYLKIKNKLAKKYPKTIKSFRFYHSGQFYNYNYHILLCRTTFD